MFSSLLDTIQSFKPLLKFVLVGEQAAKEVFTVHKYTSHIGLIFKHFSFMTKIIEHYINFYTHNYYNYKWSSNPKFKINCWLWNGWDYTPFLCKIWSQNFSFVWRVLYCIYTNSEYCTVYIRMVSIVLYIVKSVSVFFISLSNVRMLNACTLYIIHCTYFFIV